MGLEERATTCSRAKVRWALREGALVGTMLAATVITGGCTKTTAAVTPAPIAVTVPPGTASAAVPSPPQRDKRRCPSEEIAGARIPAQLSNHATIGTGLLAIHHGDDLTPNPESDSLLFLEPVNGSRLTSRALISFITNANPISQDIQTYGQALQGAREKALTGYALISRTSGACYRNVRGIETRWTYYEATTQMQGRACAFIHNCHGYSLMYAFDPQKPEDEARLRAVVEAAEITD